MKINSTTLTQPIFARRNKKNSPSPPWRYEVPPDSVDVQLIPRRNLYARAPLRFHQLGTSSTQAREALSFYREELQPFPEGTPSRQELTELVAQVRAEREEQRLIEQRSIFEAPSLSSSAHEAPQLEVSGLARIDEGGSPSSTSPSLEASPSGAALELSEEQRLDEAQDHGRRFAEWVRASATS
jgi:hypothetical protein